MKWVVITLLLINVGYAAWQFSGIGHAPQPVSKVTESHTLLLASERKVPEKAPQPVVERTEPIPDEPSKAAAPVVEPALTKPIPSSSSLAFSPQACFTVGPFLLVSDVATVASYFEEAGIATQQRAAAERKQVGVWVYIPPTETLQDAREILRQLKDKEINDALIISEGAKANAISAGVYHADSQAEARKAEIKKIGYNAIIEPLYRTQPQYWLDLELFKQSSLPKRIWQRAIKDFPTISQQKRQCEE